MVAVAAWWDRHGIMGVGEGRDPKLGAWCLVPVLPLSGPAVSWRVASARHRIDGGGGVWSGRGHRGGLGGMLFPTSRPSAPTPIRSPSDGALPFRGATPNGGLSHGTSELKPTGATCRPHRPRLRLKLESTEERLGRSSEASWQKGVQDIFQLGLASCFLRPTTSRGQPFPDPTAKRLAVANSAVPLSITAAHIIPVGTFAGVFYQEDSSNEWSCSFSFHLTSPNFCPSVTVGTKRPLTSQPRRRRAGPLNPYLHRSHPSQRNETLKHVASTLVMPLLDRIQVLFSFFSCGQAAVDSERQA